MCTWAISHRDSTCAPRRRRTRTTCGTSSSGPVGATSISGAWAWRTSRSTSPGCSDRVQRVSLLCTSCRARRPRSVSPRSYARPGGQGRDDQRRSRRPDLGRKAVRRPRDTNLDEPAGLRLRPPPPWGAGAVQGIPQRALHRDTRSGQRHPPVPGDPRTRISRQPPGRPETPRRPAGEPPRPSVRHRRGVLLLEWKRRPRSSLEFRHCRRPHEPGENAQAGHLWPCVLRTPPDPYPHPAVTFTKLRTEPRKRPDLLFLLTWLNVHRRAGVAPLSRACV